MHRRDLPASLDLLRGFEAAARLLSFTSAAAELHLTQSAVSRQVQQLEEQLGVKLFERRTRALILTEAGERYYREVSKALALVRDATSAVRAKTEPIVRVTTTASFASLWLVPRLAQFQADHGEIAVHVVADNTVRDLEHHGLDVAIRYCPQDAVGADAICLFGAGSARGESGFAQRQTHPYAGGSAAIAAVRYRRSQQHNDLAVVEGMV